MVTQDFRGVEQEIEAGVDGGQVHLRCQQSGPPWRGGLRPEGGVDLTAVTERKGSETMRERRSRSDPDETGGSSGSLGASSRKRARPPRPDIPCIGNAVVREGRIVRIASSDGARGTYVFRINLKAVALIAALIFIPGLWPLYAASAPSEESVASGLAGWQLAVLTSVLTSIATLFGHRLTVRKDSRDERERHATYVAARVVCMLDMFALRCVDVVNDEGTLIDGELEPAVATPNLEYPDLDWKTMDGSLMYRTLALPNEISSADSTIAAQAEYSSAPDYEEVWAERKFQYGRVGLYALDLAADLRRRYDLPPKDSARWNPRNILDLAYTAEDARRKKADENIKRMIENHHRKKAAKDSV